jgi:hypothetical protein
MKVGTAGVRGHEEGALAMLGLAASASTVVDVIGETGMVITSSEQPVTVNVNAEARSVYKTY